MGDVITAIVLAPLCLVFVVWGILLIMGKAYRSIAGNQEASEEEIQVQKQGGLGKVLGGLMLLVACVIGFQLFFSLSAIFAL